MPFELRASPRRARPTADEYLRNFYAMRSEAQAAGCGDMSLDDINAEIAAARAERRVGKSCNYI